MAEDKTTIELAPILHLPPLNKEEMQPYALKRYLEFLKELYNEMPLDELNDEDLTDDERAKRKDYTDNIVEWLEKCNKDSGEGALIIYPYSSVVTYYMRNLKITLKAAYERKIEKARREADEKKQQARQEAEKQSRLAALSEISPPVHDAEIYLTGEEQQQFITSTIGAVDAYLGVSILARGYHPDIWHLSPSAADYVIWTGIIAKRKNGEARRRQAEVRYNQFVKEVGDTIKKFQQELIKEKKPSFTCPSTLAKYHPYSWCELALPDDRDIRAWGRPQVLEKIPQILRPFTSMVITPQVIVNPRTEYQLVGCPCLTLHFDTYVAARVDLHLKESTVTREYYGWKYSFSLEATKLGTMYLGYCLWESEQGFSVPLALLRLIASMETEGPGIEVLNQDSGHTVYIVDGYEESFVELRKRFIDYIRTVGSDQPLSQALLSQGLVDEDTAKLIEAKWDEPLPVTVKPSAVSSPDLEAVKVKLLELGWAAVDVEHAMESVIIPDNATTEDILKAILEKPCGEYV